MVFGYIYANEKQNITAKSV